MAARGRHFAETLGTAQLLSESSPSSTMATMPPTIAAVARTATAIVVPVSLFDFLAEVEALAFTALATESDEALFASAGVAISEDAATAASSLFKRISYAP